MKDALKALIFVSKQCDHLYRGKCSGTKSTTVVQKDKNPGSDIETMVAMQGELKLKGLIGRIMQPFVRV